MRSVSVCSLSRSVFAGLILLLISACAGRQETGTPPGLDGNEMYGQSDMEWVLENISIFATRTDLIRPDRATVRFLHGVREPVRITIFMGSWSVVAQIHVPELFAALRAADNRRLAVRVVGLDRRLRDRDGLALEYGIDTSLTIVIENRGLELGRIIEVPASDAAGDVVAILRSTLNR